MIRHRTLVWTAGILIALSVLLSPTRVLRGTPDSPAPQAGLAGELNDLAAKNQWREATNLVLSALDINPESPAAVDFVRRNQDRYAQIIDGLLPYDHPDLVIYAQLYSRGLMDPTTDGGRRVTQVLRRLFVPRHGTNNSRAQGPEIGFGTRNSGQNGSHLGYITPGFEALVQRLLRLDGYESLKSEAACLLGLLYWDKGDKDAANVLLRKAIELGPNADGGYRAATILHGQGEKDFPEVTKLGLVVNAGIQAKNESMSIRGAYFYVQAGGESLAALKVLADGYSSRLIPDSKLIELLSERLAGLPESRVEDVAWAVITSTKGRWKRYHALFQELVRLKVEGRSTRAQLMLLDQFLSTIRASDTTGSTSFLPTPLEEEAKVRTGQGAARGTDTTEDTGGPETQEPPPAEHPGGIGGGAGQGGGTRGGRRK